MTKYLEWDIDNPVHRRWPRVEIMEPEPARRVEIAIRRHRPASPFLPIFLGVIAVMLLWRFKLGLLMLAALVGPERIEAAMFVVALLAVVSRWHRRSGRPF
jgi:hypothetical protein